MTVDGLRGSGRIDDAGSSFGGRGRRMTAWPSKWRSLRYDRCSGVGPVWIIMSAAAPSSMVVLNMQQAQRSAENPYRRSYF
jgi:hypothetical protein